MKTLNLFKSIKNISYLTAFACLPLSSAYGTEPQEIIEAYANDTDLCKNVAGNVLAYKNIKGKTVVLKSGKIFAKEKKGNLWQKNLEYDASNVYVVPLENILNYMAYRIDDKLDDSIESFGKCCKEGNDDWYTHIQSKDPYKGADPCEFIKGSNKAEPLHDRLGKFRHTEIQVQALLKKYNDICEFIKKYDQKKINETA